MRQIISAKITRFFVRASLHQEKMFSLSGAHSFLSRLSSEDAFEKETSLESSRRLLAKVILFFIYLPPSEARRFPF